MHACPNCRVPLHGHEQFCPSCGAQQVVSSPQNREFGSFYQENKEPSINWMPFVITGVILLIGLFFAAQGSWIGELLTKGPAKVDPIDKMTYLEAREIIENKLKEGLDACGAKATMKWTQNGIEAQKSAEGPIELSIDTRLSEPNLRKGIVDPIKDYMGKAYLTTLTMKDSKSRATWTYNATIPQPKQDDGMIPELSKDYVPPKEEVKQPEAPVAPTAPVQASSPEPIPVAPGSPSPKAIDTTSIQGASQNNAQSGNGQQKIKSEVDSYFD